MGEGFLLELLKLLFGQVGVLGTVLIAFGAFTAYLYITERKAHDVTRTLMLAQNDARFKILESNLQTLKELQSTVSLLADRSIRHG